MGVMATEITVNSIVYSTDSVSITATKTSTLRLTGPLWEESICQLWLSSHRAGKAEIISVPERRRATYAINPVYTDAVIANWWWLWWWQWSLDYVTAAWREEYQCGAESVTIYHYHRMWHNTGLRHKISSWFQPSVYGHLFKCLIALLTKLFEITLVILCYI